MEIVVNASKTHCFTASDLVDQYGGPVFKLCRALTYCKEDAEDLFQETFVKAFEQLSRINAAENPQSYLFSIASYTWKSHKRKHARRNRLAPVETLTETAAAGESAEESVITQEEARTVRAMVNALPDKYKLPLILHYTLEMRVTDIASALSLPGGTIKSRLYKARKLIEKGLKENEQ